MVGETRGSLHADVLGPQPQPLIQIMELPDSALFDEHNVVCRREDFKPGNGIFSSILVHAGIRKARFCSSLTRCQRVDGENCDGTRGQGWSRKFLTDKTSRAAGAQPGVRSREEPGVLLWSEVVKCVCP